MSILLKDGIAKRMNGRYVALYKLYTIKVDYKAIHWKQLQITWGN